MKISFKTTGHNRRYGLSLIEVLVGLSVTLIVLLAMTEAFRFASGEMAKGRASVELTNNLRTVEDLLRSDLQSLTVDARPHYNLSAPPKGYFEIVDGPATDVNYIPNLLNVVATGANVNRSVLNLAMGDYDDIVSGTIRSSSIPFRGRNNGAVVQSSLAEVIWFTVPNDPDGDFFVDATERATLYRRVLVIEPTLGKVLPAGTATYPDLATANANLLAYQQSNDVSVRVVPGAAAGTFIITANSLEDLSIRGNRFFAATQGLTTAAAYRAGLLARRSADGQDIFMSDVAAFDVQVFDPNELVIETSLAGGEPLLTGSNFDLNTIAAALGGNFFFDTTGGGGGEGAVATNVGGAFLDLGKGNFSGNFIGALASPLGRRPFGYATTAAGYAISTRRNFVDVYYDTGTPDYGNNNINDDDNVLIGTTLQTGLIDEGSDGIDNDADGLVDELPSFVDVDGDNIIDFSELDPGESEVPSPYTVPIRGIRVVVRGIEPTTKQVSQVTVTEALLAE